MPHADFLGSRTEFERRRQLSGPQKKSYIDAVLCLTRKTAKSGIANAVNRFDDHEAVHNNQKPDIHWVGHFVLWHRYFVATYEKALRDECGYTGGQPYVQREGITLSLLLLTYLQVLGLVFGCRA